MLVPPARTPPPWPAPRSRHRRHRAHAGRGATAAVALLCVACYRGGEREKEPPPGYAGGLCLSPTTANPAPHCNDDLVCLADPGFCYDPFDPCEGVFCGGSDRGQCQITQEGTPSCVCLPGFSTDAYDLLCCPTGTGIDEVCGPLASVESPTPDPRADLIAPGPDAG